MSLQTPAFGETVSPSLLQTPLDSYLLYSFGMSVKLEMTSLVVCAVKQNQKDDVAVYYSLSIDNDSIILDEIHHVDKRIQR